MTHIYIRTNDNKISKVKTTKISYTGRILSIKMHYRNIVAMLSCTNQMARIGWCAREKFILKMVLKHAFNSTD